MKQLSGLILLFSFALAQSCTNAPSVSQQDFAILELPAPDTCAIDGNILPGNSILLKEIARQLVLKADSATLDPEHGESHRILEIYSTSDCALLERKVLPVNKRPDLPYFLAEINYNHSSKMVAIRGASDVYCYDVLSGRLLPPLTPVFASERPGRDSLSGSIQRLELWELYLLGHAADFGAFAYDLSDAENPAEVLPLSEFKDPETTNFYSLFLLPSASGGFQALMPVYDTEAGTLQINPLFEAPIELKADSDMLSLNEAYLILRDASGLAILIDMRARKQLDVPEELRHQGDQAIRSWLADNL